MSTWRRETPRLRPNRLPQLMSGSRKRRIAMAEFLTLPVVAFVILLLYIFSVLNIIPEYERGVIFRLGRLLPEAKGPGLILVFRPIDRLVRVMTSCGGTRD